MPVTIKTNELKYKDPTSGSYFGINVVAERTQAEMLGDIADAGEVQLDAIQDLADDTIENIQNEGAAVLASIPSEYTELSETVDGIFPVLDSLKQMFAESEEETLVNDHEAGEVFICGGKLYRVIQDCSSGDALLEGTNVVSTTLADFIKEFGGSASSGGGGGGSGSGGGGGVVNTATMNLYNASGWTFKTVASGAEAIISITWNSLEDGLQTGDGVMTVIVNNITKSVRSVPQGTVNVDVSDYLSAGTNTIRIQVADSYGNTRPKNFTIEVAELTISSSFDQTINQSGALDFRYTLSGGNLNKTVHFLLDGTEVGTDTTTENFEKAYQFAAQSHGAHTIDVYFTAVISGETISSNTLHYDVMWVDPQNSTKIIASSFNTTTAEQYSAVNIPYRVYDPTSQVADVTITLDGVVVSTLTNVGRIEQIFSYRLTTSGSHTIRIASGAVYRDFEITVTAVELTVAAISENLAMHFSSSGRNNSEAHPEVWTSGTGANTISATLTGFNWISDGWQQDSDGVTVLRVAGDARVTIPYQIFQSDFRTTGKTIEVEFATSEVKDYDATVFSCFSGGRGLKITSQRADLIAEQSGIFMQYKENEHVRLSFVVEKRSADRLMYIYVNGIMSGVIQYDNGEDFSQLSPVGITIGNNDCTTDLYNIRIYDTDLNREQVLMNWIADTQDFGTMMSRFERNDIYDQYHQVTIDRLPFDLPYFIIECAELPQYKGDKKTCSGEFVDPQHPEKNFTFTNCQIDVQGTSSQYYERKNYKLKFKSGFTMLNGTVVSKYQMRSDSIPVNTFCFKADVASSEGANNVELARLYDATCPYKTPGQQTDARVRQGIDGFPMVIFWRDTTTETTSFLGKYNFNNDKSTEDVFGFVEGDESWELLNNTSNRVLWKSNDFAGSAWLNDFEARYPDTDPPYEDPTQLAAFATWIKSTDTTQATGNALAQSVIYPSTVITHVPHVDDVTGQITYEEVRTTQNITYTTDTAAYRLAKFRNEIGEYVELESAEFYYLFTELFLMIDSRAKNMFPSFMGTSLV